MGHLPGLFTALCLQCYYIYFSWRRVTCAPHLSSELWIEPCKPGLETLWTGLLRSGAQLSIFSKASSPYSWLGEGMKGVGFSLTATGALACLPPAFCSKTCASGSCAHAMPSYLQIRIFNDSLLRAFFKTASSLCVVPGPVLTAVYKERLWRVSQ